ncbi:MAG: hypothetical protein KF886_19240 [Candidatus Hydrogenedentes bacterium]|nr:hypothetical protein [Candidatus Hydrogenedentota bacterium]
MSEVPPTPIDRQHLIRYISLKLAAQGLPTYAGAGEEFLDLTGDLVRSYREKSRLLSGHLCPVDQRIQDFLDDYLAGESFHQPPRLPGSTFVLDRPGLARELSLPVEGDHVRTELLESYRLQQGVLHNPRSDRRTTKGVFHVAAGGLPVPLDKKETPRRTFGNLLIAALDPPAEMLELPFLAGQPEPARTLVSLLLRPLVAPEVPGHAPAKRMETRFFAPGSLIANLDFVETIFGNAGDPALAENDAALDVEHWTGHTGCVILAPHLTQCRKKDLGLPHFDEATPRQRREGMCWQDEAELYNDGGAFKITCRDDRGVMVTLIADNYFGYCKKEVKTQLSYAANLYGNCEEEHAGGALAYARFSLGDKFHMDSRFSKDDHTFAEMVSKYGSLMHVRPEGYAIDKRYPDIIYVPENVHIDLNTQRVYWEHQGAVQEIPLHPNHTYVNPDGYKVHMDKHPGAPSWRLVGTGVEGTFCHKPCTVSGGGKSEISKSLLDAIHYGPFFVADFKQDLDRIEGIMAHDFSHRFRDKSIVSKGRPLLSPDRSLGSVIRLLTPSEDDYTPEYNAWLATIPDYLKAMIFIIKRFYRPEWGDDWRGHFGADIINGRPGHELKYNGRKVVASYLRVGLQEDGSWRTYKLRQDFLPAAKIQKEDDISATAVAPAEGLDYLNPHYRNRSVKLVENCEMRLFQRPDEAIHRGQDKQTERDLAEDGNFISNFEPLARADAQRLQQQTIAFHEYTEPMQGLIRRAAASEDIEYFVSSAHPRIVDGAPTKNPRYLQLRPDLADPRERYLGEVATRLHRRVPLDKALIQPVNAVLPGRRNNPPDRQAGIRPLAVYNPIHYQELPELFMDFISSLTGKSPSTTGAGSEGALTKGPFNCLTPTSDLNNALVSYILTDYHCFTTAAGYIGPHYRVDHDVSLLIPEVWCRLSEEERDPARLIAEGCLEKLEDFEHNGQMVLASRLGYRMTRKFLSHYFGRVFDSPTTVFNDEMLRPETQDLEAYADGINNITEAQQRCAQAFFDDGSIASACPPLAALLHIMAHGDYGGKGAQDPEVRRLFTREYLIESDWYQERLRIKQERDCALWRRHIHNLSEFMKRPHFAEEVERLKLADRLVFAKAELQRLEKPAYRESLVGTLGADPLYRG